MNKGIVIVVILLLIVSAVLGFMWYRSQNSNDNTNNNGPLQVVFNGDGTVSQRPVSTTEYFVYSTNPTDGVSDKTMDDPMEMQYYTDKTTRESIWNGMKPIPNNPEYRECTAPGCVRVSVTDKEGMQTLVDEVLSDMKPGAKDMRAFLVQKGLHTTEAFVARYKEYNPRGFYEYENPTSVDTYDETKAMHDRFMLEVLIKGFAEFKNVPVPSDMTHENYEVGFDSFYDQVYPLNYFLMVAAIMYGYMVLSDQPRRALRWTNGENITEWRLGVDFSMLYGVLLILTILMVKEGKTIDSVVYNPPNNPKTNKQLKNAFMTKLNSLKRLPIEAY